MLRLSDNLPIPFNCDSRACGTQFNEHLGDGPPLLPSLWGAINKDYLGIWEKVRVLGGFHFLEVLLRRGVGRKQEGQKESLPEAGMSLF
jgi:hypothetical protein